MDFIEAIEKKRFALSLVSLLVVFACIVLNVVFNHKADVSYFFLLLAVGLSFVKGKAADVFSTLLLLVFIAFMLFSKVL